MPPVPAALADLSTTPGSNSPAGGEPPTVTDDYLRTHAAFLAMLRDGAGNPIGTILPYAGTSAPTGYLLCNGAAVSRITYAALYAVIGTAYGSGDGASTFNLPNFVDRMPIGAGNLYANGTAGGSKDAIVVSHTHTYSGSTGQESAAHTHSVFDPTHTHNWGHNNQAGAGGGSGNYGGTSGGYAEATSASATGISLGTESAAHTHLYSGTTNPTGAAATDANLPPYLGARFIIKT